MLKKSIIKTLRLPLILFNPTSKVWLSNIWVVAFLSMTIGVYHSHSISFSGAATLAFFSAVIFIILGLRVLVADIYILFFGRRVVGKVIGGFIQKHDRSDDDGYLDDDESFYAVYEYPKQDGSTCIEKANYGDTIFFQYKTGQTVNLIIFSSKEGDEVHHAENQSLFTIPLIIIGLGLIALVNGTAAALSAGIVSAIFLIIGLMFSFMLGYKKDDLMTFKKHINSDEIIPIETLVKMLEKRDQEKRDKDVK